MRFVCLVFAYFTPETTIPLATALTAVVGFVLMVLGIYEIGGLFNLGVGFAVFWIGAIAALVSRAAADLSNGKLANSRVNLRNDWRSTLGNSKSLFSSCI